MTCDRPRDNWLVFTAGCMGAGMSRESIIYCLHRGGSNHNHIIVWIDIIVFDSKLIRLNMFSPIFRPDSQF